MSARLGRWSCTTLALLASCNGAPTPPPQPTPDQPSSLPTPAVDPAAGSAGQMLRLDNGLTVYTSTATTDADTQVQLGVFAGALFVAPGLAELAAEALVQSSDPAAGTASLAQTIERLGGTIQVQVGLLTTWFDVRVPRGRGRSALEALRAALESTTRSRHQIERMRDELVARVCRDVARDPLRTATRALLLAERSTEDYVNGLLDLDASQVSLFHERLYRPERCIVHYREGYPATSLERNLREPAEQAINGWRAGPATPGASDMMARRFEPGIYWAETTVGDPRARVALVLRRPQAGDADDAAFLVLQACLTLDGTGGRLERLQDEAGLGHLRWVAQLQQTPDAEALVMTTEATAEEAVTLWRTVLRARQSLIDVPPTASELQLAFRRTQLSAELPLLDADTRLRHFGRMAMRNLPADSVRRSLDQLRQSKQLREEIDAAARRFVEQPLWMVVVGPRRPETFTDAQVIHLLPQRFQPSQVAAAPVAGVDNEGPWLRRAIEACGGRDLIERVNGFVAKATLQPSQAPVVIDEIEWHADGTLLRQRTVLDQVVTTKLEGTSWSEALANERRSLTANEAEALRHEMARHPLMLLAAHARGEIAFRSIAERQVGDRRLMVLEAKHERFERLRLHIDVESALVRVVETWQRFDDGSIVHVLESWGDYRDTGGLRAPHRRRSSWNDGQHESDSVFGEWRPLFAPR